MPGQFQGQITCFMYSDLPLRMDIEMTVRLDESIRGPPKTVYFERGFMSRRIYGCAYMLQPKIQLWCFR